MHIERSRCTLPHHATRTKPPQPMTTLSIAAARTLHLAAQGLLSPPRRKAVKDDVLAAIRRMAQLQIDTIHVVARSPYLVLFSRIGPYPPQWLDEHLAEGRLFEYWSHEACFVPIEDYGLLRHRMLDPSNMGWKYAADWHQRYKDDIDRLLDHVRENGPVRAADFEREAGRGNGWWDWKPEKRHLEVLFTLGHLMVAERRNFHRVYDIAERVLPRWNDTRDLPAAETVQPTLVARTCRALGVARADWIADYYRIERRKYTAELHALADRGEVIPARVEGWKEDAFVSSESAPLLDDVLEGRLRSTVTTVLSPFDPVVWDRKRAAMLFDFDYAIECYTPAAKRKYGYFCLPILHRGRLIGRVDAKAHRAQGVFELKSFHLEPGVRVSATMLADVRRALVRCAEWHGTPQLAVGSAPREIARALLAQP